MALYCTTCNQVIRQRSKPLLMGVIEVKGKRGTRYKAQLTFNGEVRGLGTFATESEAHEAYLKARHLSNINQKFTKG